MEFSKSFYPNEFSGLLYCKGTIISEIYILPGTHSNENSAVLRLDLAPMTLSLKGSVHSHPSGFGNPSLADKSFFLSKQINIIAYYPFDLNSYRAYGKNGQEIFLKIIERNTLKNKK